MYKQTEDKEMHRESMMPTQYEPECEMPCRPMMPCEPAMPYQPMPPYAPYGPQEYYVYTPHPHPYASTPMMNAPRNAPMMDYGPCPFSADIYQATLQNPNFRTTLWTGSHLQMTLMCIPPCEEIGVELHPSVDQFFCFMEGEGLVLMGESQDNLYDQRMAGCNCAIIVPACTWHNIVNTGACPLKLFSIYAPPNHPHGTVHMTKADALMAEG